MVGFLSDDQGERIARGLTQSYRWAIAGLVAYAVNISRAVQTPSEYFLALVFILLVIVTMGLIDAFAFQKGDPDL